MGEERKQSLLARIGAQIPGFAGYAEQTQRLASDRQTRQRMRDQLGRISGQFERLAAYLVERGQLDGIEGWERLRQLAERLSARLQSTSHESAGLFTRNAVDEDRLEDLYDLEADILDQADQLARDLEAAGPPQTDLQAIGDQAKRRLEGIASLLDRREDLIRQL